jgi:hypothetical protein
MGDGIISILDIVVPLLGACRDSNDKLSADVQPAQNDQRDNVRLDQENTLDDNEKTLAQRLTDSNK